jgi:hypothetical protein
MVIVVPSRVASKIAVCKMFLRTGSSTTEGNFPLREIINKVFRTFAAGNSRAQQPCGAPLSPASGITIQTGFSGTFRDGQSEVLGTSLVGGRSVSFRATLRRLADI